MPDQDRCDRCDKPSSWCVCDRLPQQRLRTRVLILQHPQEQDRDLGTASLLLAALPTATKRVGLSWASLASALGEDDVDPKRWAVLYPSSLKRALTPAELAAERVLLDRDGARHAGAPFDGIVALDGSWSQAKAIWWRNAWLLKLGRVVLHPKEPSIYGRLRKAPRREALSTVESVAEALVGNGEAEAIRTDLRRAFRTMLQRARDASANLQEPQAEPEPDPE
ncbi:MAG: tRNA-uridine aminocarboxypropyltransferase [Polyangiales bacterium]